MTQLHSSASDSSVKKTSKKTSRRQKNNKPHEWNNIGHDPVRGEKAMWKAVITQALMDALSRSGKAEDQYQKHEALRWLNSNSKDFKTVCFLAGEEPDYIRARIKKALASPRPWRAQAGTGLRYEERRAYRSRIKATPPAQPPAAIGGYAIVRLPLETLYL